MTIKEFYTKKAMEEFDEALYENAKHKARKVVFMILYIVFFALAVILLIGAINDNEFLTLFVLIPDKVVPKPLTSSASLFS